MIGKLVRGAVGLGKAMFGVDMAEPQVVQWRLYKCLHCPYKYYASMNMPLWTKFGPWACRQCGCFIKAKVQIASEQCPMGKW